MPPVTSFVPWLAVVVAIAGLAAPCPARALDSGQPLFATTETLAVTIAAPIRAVQKERDSGEYFEGTLSYADADGKSRVLDLKLRARGKYRRQTRICRFPPIRLNFKKKQLADTVFAGQDKLKLVTHCRTGKKKFEQLLLKEYLAYRLLDTLADVSFGTRLLRVTWQDSEDPDENFEHFAFLIEDEELLAKRIGMPLANARSTKPGRLDAEQATRVGLFQYLIGNTDFSMLAGPKDDVCCHNVVLYDNDGRHLPVPYDFDFSGIVNAPYAEPNPRLKIKSVRTRLYRGRCEHNSLLAPTIERFRARRAELFALIEQQEGFDDRQRRDVRRFVEEFFEVIDDPRDVERRLVRECG